MSGHVFRAGSRLYMIRCPECGKENYAMSVSSGTCCWCGETARECHLLENQRHHIKIDEERLASILLNHFFPDADIREMTTRTIFTGNIELGKIYLHIRAKGD